MAISTALNTAISGLTAATKRTDVISGNLANALTPGYSRRDLDISSRSAQGVGIGVQVNGVIRNHDPILVGDRRIAEAEFSRAQTEANYFGNIERILGTPEEGHSLSSQVAALESALIAATSRPDSENRLSAVLSTAQSLVRTLGNAADAVQDQRARADAEIASQVETLNTTLRQIADVDRSIMQTRVAGHDTSGLEDQRQLLTDVVSTILPVKELTRDNGQTALYTPGGTVLVDGQPAVFQFTATPTIVADSTLASGALSGLTVNGRPVDTTRENGPISGGTLAAQFQIRDSLAPGTQADLDAFARDIMERFEAVADPANPASGLAGLFTDNGAVFDPAVEEGLSGRLSVNALVDPDNGGSLSLIRDGLTATGAGPVSATANIEAWLGALTDTRSPASGAFSGGSRSASGLASDVLSNAGAAKQFAESEMTFRSTQYSSLRQIELGQGVNTDDELQKLLVVEKAYTANVKVIQAADEMLQTLLRI